MFKKVSLRSFSTLKSAVVPKSSAVFARLKTGPMKRLYKYYTADAVNLAGGVPMDSIFPIKKIQVELENEETVSLEIGNGLSLNYLRGDGLPELRDWIKSHIQDLHAPKCEVNSCMTVGSTDALAKVIQLIDTDAIIFDQFAYGTAVSVCHTQGKVAVGVAMDEEGMVPSSLRDNINLTRAKGLTVNLLYLVPVAQNPTGNSISEKRKQEILDVCNELDVIVIEDDAYYYLHFGEQEVPGMKHLPKSFLSLDTEGRVIRFDSLSKFVAPGMRIGWIVGPSDFIEKYQLLQEQTTQFPSGLSQSVLMGVLKHWAQDGLHKHLVKTQEHYRDQRNVMLAALEEHVGARPDRPALCTYAIPSAGMFMWLTVTSGIPSFKIFQALAAAGVITVPGGDFMVPIPTETLEAEAVVAPVDPSVIRLTYAAASPEQIRSGVARLADGLRQL